MRPSIKQAVLSVSGDSDEEMKHALALSATDAKPPTGLFCICIFVFLYILSSKKPKDQRSVTHSTYGLEYECFWHGSRKQTVAVEHSLY